MQTHNKYQDLLGAALDYSVRQGWLEAVDVRTIQALMRHDRLTTTEQYLAYAPQPDLADQITRALDPHSLPTIVPPIRLPEVAGPTFLERLEKEIPAKWLREVQRLYAETSARL